MTHIRNAFGYSTDLQPCLNNHNMVIVLKTRPPWHKQSTPYQPSLSLADYCLLNFAAIRQTLRACILVLQKC